MSFAALRLYNTYFFLCALNWSRRECRWGSALGEEKMSQNKMRLVNLGNVVKVDKTLGRDRQAGRRGCGRPADNTFAFLQGWGARSQWVVEVEPWERSRRGAHPTKGGAQPMDTGSLSWRVLEQVLQMRGAFRQSLRGIGCREASSCRAWGDCRCLLSSLIFTVVGMDEAAPLKGTEWLPWGPCVCPLVLAKLPMRLKWGKQLGASNPAWGPSLVHRLDSPASHKASALICDVGLLDSLVQGAFSRFHFLKSAICLWYATVLLDNRPIYLQFSFQGSC